MKLNYMTLHVDLHVHMHECRPAVYLLAVAELASSLAPLSETLAKLDSFELLMRMLEYKQVTAEFGPSLELLLEISLRVVG